MRAIIIEDKDCRALLDQLKLAALKDAGHILRDDPDKPPTLAEVHGVFHFVVVRWLQAQGASIP